MILIGGLAKSGIMPFHGWIPDAASVVPASTMAYITASVNNLLGIYLIMRMSYSVFDISSSLAIRLFLMTIGAITIVVAVYKAFVQKEAMKFLAFQGIAQVGYMIMGIGTGLPIGIAAAVFYMINNTIAKASLFLSIGSIEYRTKTTQFDELGGLRRKLPVTMAAFIIAALAISDIPPLNGFYSKWMLYQGVIQLSKINNLGFVFLGAMMFGGVLTFIAFLKTIYILFLRKSPKRLEKVYEPRFEMVTPTLILALACIVFGIFVNFVLSKIIDQSILAMVLDFGSWSQMMPTSLIVINIFLAIIFFLFVKGLRPKGGGVLDERVA